MRTRVLFAAALLVIIVASSYVYSTYLSRYYFTLANRTSRSEDQREENLRNSIRMDPSYGYPALQMAATMMRHGKYGGAVEYQLEGMKSFRPVAAYEQMGSIQLRLGNATAARSYFQKALRMRPDNITALESLSYLAFQSGDSAELNQLSEEISNLDMDNLNSLYLRGRDAERNGNLNGAFANYQRISASLSRHDVPPQGLFFTKKELETQLEKLQRQMDPR